MSKPSKVRVSFYANLRQAAGQKYIDFPIPKPLTVGELMVEIIVLLPVLEPELISNKGNLHENLNILVNGRDIRYLNGHLDTLLAAGDQVSVFPALSGGTERYNGNNLALFP
ncbi:MAG TPA: ubiquitin-like small modifier protein 1 [Anaerolineales bacterium]|jgi:MoaD family protein|nr:ubiquitin-like small modifier protein 1 [Anaerolineales bacterium]